MCIDLTDVPVKSEKDAITRAEMPKLNVYNKSGLSLSSSSSSEEDNVEQQMRGGEERMEDSPIKERSQPLEASGGVTSSNTDAKKSALDDDVLKGMYCMDYAPSYYPNLHVHCNTQCNMIHLVFGMTDCITMLYYYR